MPRKGWVARREVPADSVYASDLVQKFINSMMWDGKRSTAQRIFYTAMERIAQKTNDDALKTFKKAVENCKPVLEVKTRVRKNIPLEESLAGFAEVPEDLEALKELRELLGSGDVGTAGAAAPAS